MATTTIILGKITNGFANTPTATKIERYEDYPKGTEGANMQPHQWRLLMVILAGTLPNNSEWYIRFISQYYVSTAPEVHLDTAHWNGVDRNGDSCKSEYYPGGGAVRTWDAVWFDRTNNKHPYFRYNATQTGLPKLRKEMDLVISLALHLPLTITFVTI